MFKCANIPGVYVPLPSLSSLPVILLPLCRVSKIIHGMTSHRMQGTIDQFEDFSGEYPVHVISVAFV